MSGPDLARLRMQLQNLLDHYNRGVIRHGLYPLIKKLEEQIAELEQKERGQDRSFVQQSWPMTLTRGKRNPGERK